MALFRRDNAAALKKAEVALAAAETKITELESTRLRLLQESDELSPVHEADKAITEQRQAAATYADRVQVLKAALKQERAEEAERAHQAGIAIIAARLQKRVELARRLDAILREFETVWHALLDRSAVIADWPPGVPLPPAEALLDIRPLWDELGWRLYACGRPAWNRSCSVPAPKPAVGVTGLEPKGLVGATEAMGQGLLARLRHSRLPTPDDESEAA